MTAAPAPPPGWYPDPSGGSGQRYWDGQQWTDVNAPLTSPRVGSKSSPLKTLAIIGAAVFALVGGCAACAAIVGHNVSTNSKSSSSSPSSAGTRQSTPSESRQTSTAAPQPGIGQEVRDGKFAFNVHGVSTSKTVGATDDLKTAQGTYVVVSMTVTNTGNRSQGYYGNNQKLIDSSGREFSPDGLADIAMNGDLDGTDVNPGNHIDVRVAFDVPDGTKPAQLILHDSAYSGGVKVDLK